MEPPKRAPGSGIVLVVTALLIGAAAVISAERTVVRDEVRVTDERLIARIDINTATAAELMLLPAIGPRLAERIADDREERGPFASLADLARVPGIGPATVERITPHVVIGPVEALAVVEP